MNGNDKNLGDERRLKDLPVQAENIAFDAQEMLTCAACGRTNPPTRVRCFYCAAALADGGKLSKTQKLTLRKLENWEKGFNLICVARTNDIIDFAQVAQTFNLETETLQYIVESGKSLPILRVESEREAQIVAGNLDESGIKTKIISDQTLAVDNLPKRLRGLEFDGDKIILILFNGDEIAEIARQDLILIVKGTISERKTEAVEKRKKGEVKIVKSFDTASDEILFDLYSRQDASGYRIYAKGFDFSGLENEKGLLAAENLKKLAAKLHKFAPNARLVEDYPAVREFLSDVWELEYRREPKGLVRHSFSKFDFAKVESTENLQQFTKYSRFQRQLI